MLGILFLVLCFTTGYVICSFAFPKLINLTETDYRHRAIHMNPLFLAVPAWFFSGTLCLTWLLYIFGYLFRGNAEPLFAANCLVLPAASIFSAAGFFILQMKKRNKEMFRFDIKKQWPDIVFVLLALIMTASIMWQTFYVSGGMIKSGHTVFGDFAPHLLMARSFSYGNNFPTTYGHFAGEGIRYHFMFQFLVGNLEYLGLRIDYAFNLTSVFSMAGTYSLLYLLAVKITGSRPAGWLAGAFFSFRCSPALLQFLGGIPKGQISQTLKENMTYPGETVNEDWGLWNLNVFANQRHLAFSLAILLFALILFLPLLYRQAEKVQELLAGQTYKNKKERLLHPVSVWFRQAFFTKEAWLPKHIGRAAALGLILGLSAFFNGAVLVCVLFMLFFLAAFSDRRLEYLITASIAGGLSLLQTSFFIVGEGISPKYQFGFIAPNPTLFGALEYIFELTGIFFLVLLAVIVIIKPTERYVLFVFLVPYIMAFTLSLTPDITVNHKNIVLSTMLLGIFCAWFIKWLFQMKNITAKIAACLLVLMMTATGLYDFVLLYKKNSGPYYVQAAAEDPITLWVKENTDSQDIFLSHAFHLHPLALGGAMLYYGHSYYAWSAGYNTGYRFDMVKRMYSAQSIEELEALLEENQIRYIVVSYENRVSTEYSLNEALIQSAYERVFTTGSGEHCFDIYDTELKKY